MPCLKVFLSYFKCLLPSCCRAPDPEEDFGSIYSWEDSFPPSEYDSGYSISLHSWSPSHILFDSGVDGGAKSPPRSFTVDSIPFKLVLLSVVASFYCLFLLLISAARCVFIPYVIYDSASEFINNYC